MLSSTIQSDYKSPYTELLYTCLNFLSLSPDKRQQLLPNIWPQPVCIDNGYAFIAEQPAVVMQDLCSQYLKLDECWMDDSDYTALALLPIPQQNDIESVLTHLNNEAHTQHYRTWLNNTDSIRRAALILNALQWPALLGGQPELTQQRLYQVLDSETYGTFSAALQNPQQWLATGI